ncbi:rhodanese-like domain-containing protein [bacterium]|nr:rhodanese-like domain-containing protein [candidate division CSSED10-310 bacterium]
MRTFFEMIILLAVAMIAAFIGNTVNPKGIPIFGQWDSSVGAVHAGGPCAPQDTEISDLDVLDLYLSSGAVFVDARIQEDFEGSHIPRSVNLPVGQVQDAIESFMQIYPVTTKLIVYCSGPDCSDSHDVALVLKEYGYQDVSVYSLGIERWTREGRPTESGAGNTQDLHALGQHPDETTFDDDNRLPLKMESERDETIM